ncbi:MAG: glycosyltransferase family 4 protein [Ornithinimicrobium sp.]|uniref:glycosyltransferase family 4 protein n=1 Tax=Ornithinimicrobium sp. TaxID=1977084 RepID=UPI0026E05CFC|nr:glycosyltransferase family 4 protein [Ornithinimicrobium sp.]MDO5739466.1 glycosyltransferase family 4 protein [Ornithinimicrobium sp.]
MRILLVTGLVAGGVGQHVAMLTRGLTTAGHTVVVACPDTVAAQFGLSDLGARHVRLEVGARPHPRRDRAAVVCLRELLSACDVVHAHGLRAGALAALARAAGTTPRLVVTSHNGPPALASRGTSGPSVSGALAARLLYGQLERLVCRRADLLLAVSPDLLQRARAKGADATALAIVPAPPARVRDRSIARAVLAAELGLAGSDLVVLSIGRLAPQKQMGALISAMVRVGAEQAGSDGRPVLLIAGEGPDRAALQRRLDLPETADALDARLLGHREDVPALLAAVDVVVSAAQWEGQPVWLQEALAKGAPIVATDVGGTRQVVGEAALLVPPIRGEDGEKVLAEAIAQVLGDPTLRSDLRGQALLRAAQLPTEADAITAAVTAYRSGVAGDQPTAAVT